VLLRTERERTNLCGLVTELNEKTYHLCSALSMKYRA